MCQTRQLAKKWDTQAKQFIFIYLFNITDKGPEGQEHVKQR